MTTVAQRLNEVKSTLPATGVQLVAVSKFHPAETIREAYDVGHRCFGESRAQELQQKYDQLPHTLQWKESATQGCIDALLKKDVNEGGRYLMNDLYAPAKALCAEVGQAMAEALSFSPINAVMTGSGSCVLALFETKELCEWAKSRYKGRFKTYVF